MDVPQGTETEIVRQVVPSRDLDATGVRTLCLIHGAVPASNAPVPPPPGVGVVASAGRRFSVGTAAPTGADRVGRTF